MKEASKIKVLIACEYSGIIRNAFTDLGFNAISCDLLPTEKKGKHYKGNVFDIINNGFDLMIAHPPCTYLSFAGKRTWNKLGYVQERIKAADFFMKLYESNIKHIAIENPSGIRVNIFRAADQIIHPYYFGEQQQKRTFLWLKELPLLKYNLQTDLFSEKTSVDKPEPSITYYNKKGVLKREYFTYSKTAHERSKSFKAIADAMAEQWGQFLIENL